MDQSLKKLPLEPAPLPVEKPAKSVFVKTFGCQMNVYDTERMVEQLSADGYALAVKPEDADLIILNTCHIREKAVEKVYSDLGRLRKIKEARSAEGKATIVTVAGCVAQAEGAEIARRQPAVDIVVGPQSYHNLPDLIARTSKTNTRHVETEFESKRKFQTLDVTPRRATSPSAFLTIQEGCDKFCTFCVVPYTRGSEISRPVADIAREARSLADAGVRELTLLGQNVNAYHGAGHGGRAASLADLIGQLAAINGIERIRYMTSHPHDMTDELIAAHGEIEKLMPFLHLPVQSGSDRILAAMNRKHTTEHYASIIAAVRKRRPDIAVSSDFIVGFPGETDADAEATLALVREIGFAQAYSFKYSPRPGTPAAGRGEQIPEALKSERLVRLQELLDQQQVSFNAGSVGERLPVLLERRGRDGQLVGRSPYLQLVHVEGPSQSIGKIVPVEIKEARQLSLSGTL